MTTTTTPYRLGVMHLRPQPDLDEPNPKVLHLYILALHDELVTAGSALPGTRPAADELSAEVLHDYIGELHEQLTHVYTQLSGKRYHSRECPISQGYVYRPGPCNCDAPKTLQRSGSIPVVS